MFSRESLKGAELWAESAEKAFDILQSNLCGISEREAESRQHAFGTNEIAPKKKRGALLLFLSYFINPLILLLITVASVSYFLVVM